MKRLFLVLPAILLAGYAGVLANTVPTTLTEATVYRIGAELHHQATVNLPQGNSELTLEGISRTLEQSSIRINTGGKATILSVSFFNDYLKPASPSATSKRLMDSLEKRTEQLQAVQVTISTTKELQELLKANRQIGGTQTGLSVAELIKLMDYYAAKARELEDRLSASRKSAQQLEATINLLKLQIREEEQKNSSSAGRLLIQLTTPVAGNYPITVSYITPSAYWNPYYELLVEKLNEPVKVGYQARLVQTTGIDWKKVKLTLASSTPGIKGTAPVFQSWFLDYINPVAAMERNLQGKANSINALRGRVAGLAVQDDQETGSSLLNEAVVVRGYSSLAKAENTLYVVDGTPVSAEAFSRLSPDDIKHIEVLDGKNAASLYGARAASGAVLITLKNGPGDYIAVNENALNISFVISIPYDIPSNGKEQLVALQQLTVPAQYKYYAAPKLDRDAYLLAEIVDWEKLNLLPGEAVIMFEGTYVGKTFIDPQSNRDTLNLTLGQDKRIVISREKLKDFSSVKFLGSSRKQVLTYELTVRNNKKEAAALILKDQYPLSTNKDIEIELLENSNAIVNTEIGVLTWKVTLQPGESRKFRISYSVKYPKDKLVSL